MIPLTEGARLLSGAGTIEATAAAVGVTPRTISSWRSGAKVPSPASRRRLQEAFGIHPEAWDRRPPESPREAPTSPPTPDDGATPDDETSIDRLRRQLGRVQAQRGEAGMSHRVRLELEKLEHSISVSIARVESTRLSDAEVVRSAAWRRCKACILEALTPYPDAIEAIAIALQAQGDARVGTP